MNTFGKIMLGILYLCSFTEIIYGGIIIDWITFFGGFFAFFIAVIIDFKFNTFGEWFRGKR
jgi:hypothetical protein